MKKVVTTLDAFEPTLGASFMAAHIGSVLSIYFSLRASWELLLSIPLVWAMTFFVSLFITYPICLALTPLYLRLSHKESVALFLTVGFLFLPCLNYIGGKIPKLAVSHSYKTIAVLSTMGACISAAAWYRARKSEKRIVVQ